MISVSCESTWIRIGTSSTAVMMAFLPTISIPLSASAAVPSVPLPAPVAVSSVPFSASASAAVVSTLVSDEALADVVCELQAAIDVIIAAIVTPVIANLNFLLSSSAFIFYPPLFPAMPLVRAAAQASVQAHACIRLARCFLYL